MHASTEDNNIGTNYSFFEELERVVDQFSTYGMQDLLSDFSGKAGRVIPIHSFKRGCAEISDDKGDRAGTLPCSHRNILTYT
jgi:hypothetical protein